MPEQGRVDPSQDWRHSTMEPRPDMQGIGPEVVVMSKLEAVVNLEGQLGSSGASALLTRYTGSTTEGLLDPAREMTSDAS